MKWLTSLLAKVSVPVQIAIVAAVVVVALGLLWLTGSLDALGAWLGAN